MRREMREFSEGVYQDKRMSKQIVNKMEHCFEFMVKSEKRRCFIYGRNLKKY